MSRLPTITLAAATLLLGACTTLHSGAEFAQVAPIRQDAALVYLYRSGIPPYWRSPTLVIDGNDVSEVKNSSFTYFYLPQGQHKIATRWALDLYPLNAEGTLDLRNGQAYYLKLGGGMQFTPGIGSGGLSVGVSSNLGQVPAATALREMQGSMYIGNTLKAQ
ncbi:DUF2846 domain-containing protein [Pseudomonas mosselii]|uniref:DUF2846 domain-containing protein n=1 Tax=Pseudomonas mosselii TaxID=78327 RepID=UPI001FF8D6F8|nr:DUF2846 domain-containing protein [Pseudomonas mosselii]UPF06513.1 DUF2846 domain-containing protein [Pseudomonas mosselii]